MRRRGRPAPRVEPCGVWLDTAKLKQRPVQSLLSRPKVFHRLQERHCDGKGAVSAAQPGAVRPCTKQTTISTFFGSRTDKKDEENYRLSPLVLNKEHKEKGIFLAASPVKILMFPETEEAQEPPFRGKDKKGQITPQHPEQKALISQTFLPGSLPEAESLSNTKASCGEKEDFLDFTQDSEGNRIVAHRNAARLFAGETASASKVTSRKPAHCWINTEEGHPEQEGCDFQPGHGATQSKKRHQQSGNANTSVDFSETENIDPAIQRDRSWAAASCSSPKRTAQAQPLSERSQNAAGAVKHWGSESSPWKQLFTQDSEGNTVISHKCQKVTSPLKDKNSPRRRLINSPYKDCSRDTTNHISKLEEHQLEACYDLLFTQDSQGNRVIKH